MGWGTTDMNSVMTWGSGFIDSWSNPANQPSGTSHWVGVQTYHYVNSYNSGYGWQLVGGPIGNLRFRNSWPNNSGWTTVAMHDRNDGSGGGLYAGAYYDANDSGYYLDPNGVDNQGLRIRGGTLHGPNWSWGKYLRVGTNGRIDGNPSVATTNGNLHIDCENGYGLYLNHYSGNITYSYDFRPTIIYDQNNTGYYWNGDSVSYMNVVYGAIFYDHDSTWYGDFNSNSRMNSGDFFFAGFGHMYRLGTQNSWNAYEGFGVSNSDNGANATFEVNVYGQSGDWSSCGFNSNARKYEWYCGYTKMMDLDEGGHLRTRGAQWEWNGFSDADLKTNLQVIDNALEKISQISGYTYEFTEDSPYRNNDIEERTHGAGLIAQEVEAVLPVLVDEDWVGGEYNRYFKTLNYNGVHGLTVQGIKELKGYHDTLEDRVAALESRLEQLESRIQNLENQ
jgi:hypothetical protein